MTSQCILGGEREVTFTVQKQSKGPSQHLLKGPGKLDRKPDRDGVIALRIILQYFLQVD